MKTKKILSFILKHHRKLFLIFLSFFVLILILIYIVAEIPLITVTGITTSSTAGDDIAYFDMGVPQQTTTKMSLLQYYFLNQFKKINKEYPSVIPMNLFSEYYDKIGPDAELSVIESDPFCHVKGHNLGRVIYQKTQDLNKSIEICSNRCTTGCFHGVLMGFFSKTKPTGPDGHIALPDVFSQMKTICNDKVNANGIGKGVCIHGIGHALEYLANYDTGRALWYCTAYANKGEIYYCDTGVYMERSIVYGKQDAKNNSSYPCDTAPYPAACFRYKLEDLFSINQFSQAKRFCLAQKNLSQLRGCFHGLGFYYFESVDHGTLSLDTLCSSKDPTATTMCVQGTIGVLTEFSRDRADQICTGQKLVTPEACQTDINVGNFGMNRDFSFYTQ